MLVHAELPCRSDLYKILIERNITFKKEGTKSIVRKKYNFGIHKIKQNKKNSSPRLRIVQAPYKSNAVTIRP